MVVEYASRLAQRGHSIYLIIPYGTIDADISQELHPAVHILQTKAACVTRSSQASPLRMARLSWSLAQSIPPSDIVISTHTPTTVAGLIASRLMRRGVPVWLYQDYLEMFNGRRLEAWLAKNALRWQRRALVVSSHSKSELLGFNSAYSEQNITVVGEGLSHAEWFKPLSTKERRPAGSERYNILFLGDMRPRKGLYDFLEAAHLLSAQIPAIHLWIVSKENCHIDTHLSYEYIYRPSRPELARLYATCDLFVSASWWESFGLPPLEAMACGAPVVMTDARGARDYARPGQNCLVVPPRQPPALARAMLEVLRRPELSDLLRQNGPPTAAEFSWEKVTDHFEKVLLEVLSDE